MRRSFSAVLSSSRGPEPGSDDAEGDAVPDPGASTEVDLETVAGAVRTAPQPPVDREPLRTRFEFTLPRGYVDRSGQVHRDGVMRLATARDELLPLYDDRVKEHPAYLTVVLLARVVERIGAVTDIHAGLVENLFAADLAFLQDLYRRVNAEGHTRASVNCPACGHGFTVDVAGGRPGEW
jgi:hypothetical protein